MRFALASVLIVSGCGKQLNEEFCYAHPDDTRCAAADAATGDGAVQPDAFIATASTIYVSTNGGDLYSLDVGTMQSTLIGRLDDPDNIGTGIPVDGLGFMPDGTLIGVGADHLLRIAPATATVTSKVPLATTHAYWGVVVVPPGQLGPDAVVLAAASDTQHLYELRLDATVRDIGAYGNSLAIAGDLAWVPGAGLFGSVTGGSCSGTCIAKISPMTGAATLLASSGPGDLWAMATFAGELWAIGGSDKAYTVDQSTGVPTEVFSTGIPNVSDAAP